MNRRTMLAGAVSIPVAGCATLAAQITGGTSDAVTLWGVAKGMGQVVLGAAELLAPGLAPVVSGIESLIAAADPLVTTAATDANAAAQLVQQSNSLILAAAPLIKVVTNQS